MRRLRTLLMVSVVWFGFVGAMLAIGVVFSRLDERRIAWVVEEALRPYRQTEADVRERAERRAQLVRETRWGEFLDGLDPQDASIWTALVPYAELDRDCNALPECTDGPTHITRPITVVTRSKHGDVMFIAVLGIETWTPHGRQLTPHSTFYYYVGDQAGALWRMRPGATHGEVRDSRLAEWHPEPASDWVLNEARTAFITEWRRRLTEFGT